MSEDELGPRSTATADPEVITIPVDFSAGDAPQPCRTCEHWRHESAVGACGERVLREWHAVSCATLRYWV